jgi:hypothetical protein
MINETDLEGRARISNGLAYHVCCNSLFYATRLGQQSGVSATSREPQIDIVDLIGRARINDGFTRGDERNNLLCVIHLCLQSLA